MVRIGAGGARSAHGEVPGWRRDTAGSSRKFVIGRLLHAVGYVSIDDQAERYHEQHRDNTRTYARRN
jgi:hypothetical protein